MGLWVGGPNGESTTTVRGVSYNYQLLAVMLLQYPDGQPPVTVNQSQLQTMTSVPVDLIEFSLPPRPLQGITP